MRPIDADKVKIDSRKHCINCKLNGTEHCKKDCVINLICDRMDLQPTVDSRPQGEYVDINKLRLMTVEECAGHTIDYAMGWKACIEWIKKGGAK